jgi:hypothetical protein
VPRREYPTQDQVSPMKKGAQALLMLCSTLRSKGKKMEKEKAL